MKELSFKLKELKKFLTSTEPYIRGKQIYVSENDFLKFYYTHEDYNSYYKDFYTYDMSRTAIDPKQIEWLISLRDYITMTNMPKGIIKCEGKAIGVIYDYLSGFKDFSELYKEDLSLIFKNLSSVIVKNQELIKYGVYNLDLHSGNILYKGDDVEIVDLDGKYIKNDDSYVIRVYRNLLEAIYKVLCSRLELSYQGDDLKEVKRELYYLLGLNNTIIDSLNEDIIEDAKKLRLLK